MNEEKTKNFWIEEQEKRLEGLLQETPLNMREINMLISQLTTDIYCNEKCRAGRRLSEIENDLREKYHLPLQQEIEYISHVVRKRIEFYEGKLEELTQKEPLDLSRILNIMNIVGHYKAQDESHFQKIKQELCEKYNMPYIKHEHTLPFRQYYTHPRQETYYKYTDNTVLRVVGIPTLFEILADLLGL